LNPELPTEIFCPKIPLEQWAVTNAFSFARPEKKIFGCFVGIEQCAGLCYHKKGWREDEI